jgi:hypothetical protein
MSALIYRRAFADSFSLLALSSGRVPEMSEVRRRIFVAERRSDARRPDHFYKNYLQDRLGSVGHLHELPWAVLTALASRFVTRSAGRLQIRSEAFADWQELLPMISPLAVIVAFLVEEGRGPAFGMDPRDFLYEQIGDTALVSPFYPELSEIIERDGLNEMHMHLNGSTELDIIWSDAVRSPEVYLKELEDGLVKSGEPAREFYDQLEVGLKPYHLYQRLRAARRVRHLAASILNECRLRQTTDVTVGSVLSTMAVDQTDSSCLHTTGLPLSYRPVARIHPGPSRSPILDEAAFLYTWFQGMQPTAAPRMQLGLGLYFNMLVLTQISRISVQQIDEAGFDQFQKYTFVGVREHLERAYAARYRQLNGSAPYRVLRHLEGRLAPKKTVDEFLTLVGSIVEGYLHFKGCPYRRSVRGLRGDAPGCMTGFCTGGCSGSAVGRPDAELVLVVHFIKRRSRPSRGRVPQGRDLVLRTDLRQQAQVVRQAIERHRLVRQILRGMDAAANELHAAPEVFAPTFRYLRRHAVSRATFHVGEDFIHLVSGIRACAEAKAFLPLEAGDRMGHATALGIAPALWVGRTGTRVMICAGEHLDNLVYANAHLSSWEATSGEAKGLEAEIALRSARIYGCEQSPAMLHRAWQLRDLDILEVLELERNSDAGSDAAALARAAADKSGRMNAPARRDELARIAKAAADHPIAYALFRERHRRGDRLDELLEVETAFLSDASLTALQADVLGDLAMSGVAIETLPTSNVRISSYDRLEEHHLFRWLNLTEDRFDTVPAICVGSDDTGIFATSLRNEYAAIYDVLRCVMSIGSHEATTILEKLNRNGSAFRFQPEAASS